LAGRTLADSLDELRAIDRAADGHFTQSRPAPTRSRPTRRRR